MPEASVLYGVTGVVVLGLVAWVAIVLKTAKEPWARTLLPQVATAGAHLDDPPLETPEENDMTSEGDPITAEKVADVEEKAAALSEAKNEAASTKIEAAKEAEADAEAEANEKAKKA